MVRILPSGEIVQDDDPRAQGGGGRGAVNRGNQQPRPRQGGMGGIEREAVDHMPNPGENVFDTLNEKAASIGIPRWNLGPYVVEPIISVAFIILLLLIGIHGLLFGILLFVICKWSQSGGGPGAGWRGWMGGNLGGQGGHGGGGGDPGPGGNGGPGGVGRGWASGGGQRLGRS